MPKSISKLMLVVNQLTNSGGLSERQSTELKECIRKMGHAFAVKDNKSLSKEIDRICGIILSNEF